MRSAVSPSEDGYERKIVFFIRPAAWRLMRRPTLLRPDDVRYRLRASSGTCGIRIQNTGRGDGTPSIGPDGRTTATWAAWEANREVSWNAWEDSRDGVEYS